MPPAPESLSGEALAEWNRSAPVMVERGMLDELRIPMLEMYCAILGKCRMKMKAGDMPTAYMMQQCRTLARELGIIGTTTGPKDDGGPAKPSRWAKLKERAERT